MTETLKQPDVRSRWLRLILFLLVALLTFSFVWVRAEHSFDVSSGEAKPSGSVMLTDDQSLTQVITARTDALTGISIRFLTGGRAVRGKVIVTLREDEAVLREWKIASAQLTDDAYRVFYLKHPINMKEERQYVITVAQDTDTEEYVEVAVSKNGVNTPAELGNTAVDGQKVCFRLIHTNMATKVRWLFAAAAIFVMILVFVLLGVREQFAMSILLIVFGLIFFRACPVGMEPDAESHFYRAFEISCGHMTSMHINESGAGGNYFPATLSDFSDPSAELDWNETESFWFGNTSLYAPITYLPQAVGIRVMRTMTDNVQKIYYAGRIGNFLASMILCILALWLVPFGRKILFVIMMFPLTLQEMTSMSPDGFTIGLAMALFALILHLSYADRTIRRHDLVLLTVLALILALCKIVYVVIPMLVFLIPKDRFEKKQHYIFSKCGIPVAAILLNLAWLSVSAGYLVQFQPGVSSGEQVRYVLTHLPEYYAVAVRTSMESGAFFVRSMIGSALGPLSVEICALVWVTFLILLLFETFCSKELVAEPHPWDAPIMFLLFLMGSALIYTSLYVQWTPLQNALIVGIQGRYFIPLLPLLMFAILYGIRARDRRMGCHMVRFEPASWLYLLVATADAVAALDLIYYYIH